MFACACCRRVWQVFGEDIWNARHVVPDDIYGGRTNAGSTGRLDDLFDDAISREALETADQRCDGTGATEHLQAAQMAAWALACEAYEYHGNADYRLGDHYCLSELQESERSYLTARAVCLACSPVARVAVGEAAQAAREVIDLGGRGVPRGQEEGRSQAALLRDIFGNPFRPVAFSPSWRTDTAISLARQMYDSRDFGAMPILADALQDAGCDNDDILDHCRGDGPHVRGCWVIDLLLGKA